MLENLAADEGSKRAGANTKPGNRLLYDVFGYICIHRRLIYKEHPSTHAQRTDPRVAFLETVDIHLFWLVACPRRRLHVTGTAASSGTHTHADARVQASRPCALWRARLRGYGNYRRGGEEIPAGSP